MAGEGPKKEDQSKRNSLILPHVEKKLAEQQQQSVEKKPPAEIQWYFMPPISVDRNHVPQPAGVNYVLMPTCLGTEPPSSSILSGAQSPSVSKEPTDLSRSFSSLMTSASPAPLTHSHADLRKPLVFSPAAPGGSRPSLSARSVSTRWIPASPSPSPSPNPTPVSRAASVRGLTSSISDPVVSQSTETLTPKAPVYPSPRASDPGPKRDDGKKREGKKEKKEKKEKKHKSPSRPT